MKRIRRNGLIALFLPVQLIGLQIISYFPAAVEQFYSRGIFPVIARIERYALGWIPFSVGDLLYLIVGGIVVYWLYKRIKSRFCHPKTWIVKALAFISIIHFCFYFFWGLNYYRLPLHKSLEIKDDYSQNELIRLTESLVKKSNTYQEKLAKTDSTKVDYPASPQEIQKQAIQGYHNIEGDYPTLKYRGASVKPSLFSLPLSYMGFSGYLNPWTNEAQVNTRLPAFKLPGNTSHEIGHQLGYAKENEANFMAVINTINHPNPYFKYSGYTFALQYCLRDLAQSNPDKAEELSGQLNQGVKENFREVRKFWAQYQNPFEPFFKLFYTGYLKVNNQPKGLQSYNYVVALLVNYFQGEHEL